LGAGCAARFSDYAGTELADGRSLGGELRLLHLRTLRMLGLEEFFDMWIYCDPAMPDRLKPGAWTFSELLHWRDSLPTANVGDDPVDEKFALAGQVRFVGIAFRNPRYGN
jgi:hypothetical protein